MNGKLILAIIVIGLTSCSSAPLKPPIIEKEKTVNLRIDEVLHQINNKLPDFLSKTSSKTPKIEQKSSKDYEGDITATILITSYKPNDSNFTECAVANHGGWANIWNGLDHGIIRIDLIQMYHDKTKVIVNTGFHENYHVQAPGEIEGYVGRYEVRGTEWVDKGSHCYSTGIIERSILDFIQSKETISKDEMTKSKPRKNPINKLDGSKSDGIKSITFPDGNKFDGEVKNGNLEGQGLMTSPDGNKFVGNFIKGKLEGPGEMTWPDGTKLVAKFKHGQPEGKVTFILPNGVQKIGTFKNGEFVQ